MNSFIHGILEQCHVFSDGSSGIKLEIGHVPFVDIAGYSKLLVTKHTEPSRPARTIATNRHNHEALAKVEVIANLF
jgi:hypothetical protein